MTYAPLRLKKPASLAAQNLLFSEAVSALIEPAEHLAELSSRLFSVPIDRHSNESPKVGFPRYMFTGPLDGGDPVRLGLFGAIHGDEQAGAYALIRLLCELERRPELARGYELFVYPVCNSWGFESKSRYDENGIDLNRVFWIKSNIPEVSALEGELRSLRFDGLISLHADDTSDGIYGFVGGATLTKALLTPAIRAASAYLPTNQNQLIDSFDATESIIETCYEGVLSAPSQQTPRPFEIVFETPQLAPMEAQVQASVAAVLAILEAHRQLRGFAPNL